MFLPLLFKLQHLLCQRVVGAGDLAARIVLKDALAFGADLCGTDRTRNLHMKHVDFCPVGMAQER